MHQVTLLHSDPSRTTGIVLQTTHPDFPLRDVVQVSWPLNPFIGITLNVILTCQQVRYLANWVSDVPTLANQFTYTVIMALPLVWRPLN